MRKTPYPWLLAVVLAVAIALPGDAGCGREQESTRTGAAELEGGHLIAGTDFSRHTVPLADIYFDLFNGSAQAADEIDEQLILRLRDAIPPIDDPQYQPASLAAEWLLPDDLVLAVDFGAAGYAYPVRILNYHETVNDELNGIPVLISYCPLCASGIVFDRRFNGRTLTFGNTSALYQSDMVMHDRETWSYWFQVAGEAIVGALAGERLTVLPSSLMRWQDWFARHPAGEVLSRETGASRPYSRDPFATYPPTTKRRSVCVPSLRGCPQ